MGVAASVSSVSARAPRWLRAIFIANLVAQTGIVLTGGLVRLTGSGLGCPTWPQCVPGSFVPTAHQEQAWHKYIEFGNRTLTFVVAILGIAALAGALAWARKRKKAGLATRPQLTWLAAVPFLGTFAQALLGGITVLTGLNPITVSTHFLLSAALISLCVLLVVRSGEDGDHPVTQLVKTPVRILGRALVVVTLVVLTLGTIVTGAGPHSGDADAASRLNVDPQTFTMFHADLVWAFVGLTIGILVALYVTDSPAPARTRAWALLAMIVVQGAIGYVQYFTGLPWWVVELHLLGACLTWIVTIYLYLSLRARGTVQGSSDIDLTTAERTRQDALGR